MEALSDLLGQLSAVPAPEGLRWLADVEAALLEQAERVLLRAEAVESLVRECSAALRQVIPESGDRLLHWDLHCDNVLAPLLGAADRGSWLAIDPKPLSGDPCFELLPSLHNRWDDVVATGDISSAIRRRFDMHISTARPKSRARPVTEPRPRDCPPDSGRSSSVQRRRRLSQQDDRPLSHRDLGLPFRPWRD